MSRGQEKVAVPCVLDDVEPCECASCQKQDKEGEAVDSWKAVGGGFEYIRHRKMEEVLGANTRASQLPCQCTGAVCDPVSCCHVALFNEDNVDARDMYGEPLTGRFAYDAGGCLVLQEKQLIYECNALCGCSLTCPNRVVQKGVRCRMEVFRTRHKGWAVRAAQSIPRGTFICEYVGEVIDDQEAERRGERYDAEGLKYLYNIDQHMDEGAHARGVRPFVIDATRTGNVARFINHSCDPNLVNYEVLVESLDYQLAHIALFALRDIRKGEELAYNYHYKLEAGKGCPCHCGAPNCRGRLY